MTDAGVIVWITGLPQSGKSTLASRLRARLAPRRSCIVLDSDEVRAVLGAQRYDDAGREAFYHTLGGLAALLARQGHAVLIAATAARRAYRTAAAAAGPRYVEVWVRTPVAECEARDRKGLYAEARAGRAPQLPGMGAPYEAPITPDVIADGGLDEQALERLEALLAPGVRGNARHDDALHAER